MKLFLRLVSALIQGVEPSTDEKTRNKIFYVVMRLVVVGGIMLPMAFFVGVILYSFTTALAPLGTSTHGVELFLHLISAFSFVFGLNVIFSVFYFAGDIENLLPLPLRPWQIIGAKFTAALISESVMEFIVIIAALAGYIIGSGVPFYAWAVALVGMLTMPILPLVYCGILCLLVMYFFRFIRSKDTVNKITGLFTFLVIGALVFYIGQSGFDTEKLIQTMSHADSDVLGVLNWVFPQVPLLVDSMSLSGLWKLPVYLLVNAAAVGVFMLLAQGTYLPGVVGVSQGSSRRGNGDKVFAKLRQRSPAASYLGKEFRILLRTPAYFTNCLMINLIWPLFLYLIYVLQGQTNFLDSFLYGIRSGHEETVLTLVLGISAVSVLVTAVNCIASSALTREGKHFAFVKYIPLSYTAQLNVKALVSILISGSGMLLYVLAACLWLNTGVKFTVFCCLVSLLSVAFASYLGVFIDSINPKLLWDDELNALRGNYYVFFNMALAILIEAVICGGSYLLFRYTEWGALMIIILLFVLLMAMTAGAYLLCTCRGTRNMDEFTV